MKPMKGVLIYYFATGEAGRPQFIGDKSVDGKGLVINHSQIYDIKFGDEISLDMPYLFFNGYWMVDQSSYDFLNCLTALAKQEIRIKFKPHKGHKSWEQLLKERK